MAEGIFQPRALTACGLSRQNYYRERAEENSMADIRIMASGLGFPEGPVAMQDGSVILLRRNSVRREVRGLQFPPQDNRKRPHLVVFN